MEPESQARSLAVSTTIAKRNSASTRLNYSAANLTVPALGRVVSWRTRAAGSPLTCHARGEETSAV